MRQRSSQIVFLLLLLCALPYNEAHAFGVASSITGSDSSQHSAVVRQMESSAAPQALATGIHTLARTLPPADLNRVSTPHQPAPPSAHAAAIAGFTSLLRA